MPRAVAAALAILALMAAAPANAGSGPPIPVKVHIGDGDLRGFHPPNGGPESFLGVPFAAPPVGPLRWKPPQPVAPWTGVREASVFGPACPQPVNKDGRINGGGYAGPISEDCLNLNITAPAGARKAPVLVWIYGGANIFGANSVASYNGDSFAADGVIVVTVNYRLGALGFFAHPALTKAARPDEPLGSYALMDQIAALKWVRKNIAAFGGDPANVTLAGESAGGQDILTLLATPSAKGLFARMMVESGGGWSRRTTLAKAEAEGVALATKLGAPTDPTPDQLRALPVDALVAASGRYGPIIDHRLVPASATDVFAHGDNIHVPLIIGSNSYEASLMLSFGLPAPMYLASIPPTTKAAYPEDASNDAALANDIFTDQVMGAPARWIARKSSAGAPTWLYYFSYVRVKQRARLPGANHASEIPYVFKSQDDIPVYSSEIVDADRAEARLMHSCIVGFVTAGRPACEGGQAWPTYSPETDQLLEFGLTNGVRTHWRKPRLDAAEQQNAALLAGK
ncbi:MAG TPA: carboxylesterase family protein [Caulobacteraceae bacterium]|jgi:para-nitrobenzyl esterase|nr:carboxylesterase family protein [Caulobacteraceae bacterium]